METSTRTGDLARCVVITCLLAAVGIGLIAAASLSLGWFSVHVPDPVLSLDVSIYRWIAGSKLTSITPILFALFNDPGLDYSIAIAATLCYVWWRRRRDFPWAVAAIMLTLVIGASTMAYMQWFGFRPRPFTVVADVAVDPYWRQVWQAIPTFPSGHVRELTGLCLVLAHFWPGARWIAAGYAVVVAVTRVHLGAHFPSDVLAGAVVGLCAGGYSLMVVGRVRMILNGISDRLLLRCKYARLFVRNDEDGLELRATRVVLLVALLMGVSAIAGAILHTDTPRILADYLLNTDNSLIAPLLDRFDLSRAQIAYPFVADERIVFGSLIVLGMLGLAAKREGNAMGQLAIAILLCFAIGLLVDLLVASHFLHPRPADAARSLPDEWRALWSSGSGFPVSYLLRLMAICTVLAASWRRLAIPLYGYAIVATVGLLYFGAVWPTDAIVTLPLGHLFGRWAVSASVELLPGRWVGHDHLHRASDDRAGDRSCS